MSDGQLLALLDELAEKYRDSLKGLGIPRAVLGKLDSDILSIVRPWLIQRAKETSI